MISINLFFFFIFEYNCAHKYLNQFIFLLLLFCCTFSLNFFAAHRSPLYWFVFCIFIFRKQILNAALTTANKINYLNNQSTHSADKSFLSFLYTVRVMPEQWMRFFHSHLSLFRDHVSLLCNCSTMKCIGNLLLTQFIENRPK